MTTREWRLPRSDARLDWAPQHDSRSRDYPIREAIGYPNIEPKNWDTGPVLDQGAEGACVGFGWTLELLSSPRPDPTTDVNRGNDYARGLYYRCKMIDEWEGEDYDGTSVLAGAKVAQERGLIGNYRWCFSLEDVRDAVISEGPVVIGIPWYESMYGTRESGLVEISGPMVGGHCILVHRYHPSMRIYGEDWHARFEVFGWQNSWNVGYGKNGKGLVRAEDLRDLLAEWGEACVPMSRKLVRL